MKKTGTNGSKEKIKNPKLKNIAIPPKLLLIEELEICIQRVQRINAGETAGSLFTLLALIEAVGCFGLEFEALVKRICEYANDWKDQKEMILDKLESIRNGTTYSYYDHHNGDQK